MGEMVGAMLATMQAPFPTKREAQTVPRSFVGKDAYDKRRGISAATALVRNGWILELLKLTGRQLLTSS